MTTPRKWPPYARVPPFLPVPLRSRCDGWSEERQVRFIGYLAETGCVAEAAARVGMSRMAAYRLRARDGAESLAHAWDAIIAQHRGRKFPTRKVTNCELAEHAFAGPVRILLRRGRFLRAQRKPSISALLRHMKQLDAKAARYGWEEPW